jgi:hypothetical protein
METAVDMWLGVQLVQVTNHFVLHLPYYQLHCMAWDEGKWSKSLNFEYLWVGHGAQP